MAKNKQTKRGRTWKQQFSKYADRKTVVTTIISSIGAALILTLSQSACDGARWWITRHQERKEQRTKISEEVQHRISIAASELDRDPNLAKKHLDGVEPRYCLHERYVGVSLRALLQNYQSAGGEVGSEIEEIEQLAVTPIPTPEQLQRLIVLLEIGFPDLDSKPIGSTIPED
jgi:hypothetical protein